MIDSGADSRSTRIAWSVLLGVTLVWFAALLTRGAGLAPDEIEFFRATKWIGQGRMVYRDFWEHHTPLQWIVFAPVARLFAQSSGADAIVVMRWAQLPLWFAAVILLARIERRAVAASIPALALLLSSRTFVDRALEYRVDVPGNLLFLAALAAAILRPSPRGYLAFGGVMSLAVLANMRMAPIAILAAILLLCWHPDGRRWGWNPRALWMTGGVAGVTIVFLAWLFLTGSWSAFADAMFRYNRISGANLEVQTFADAVLAPLWVLDIGGMAFWLAGGAGCVMALRRFRWAGTAQILAVLAIASIAVLATMAVQYDYHLQTTWLLLVPFVACAYASLAKRWKQVAFAVALTGAIVSVVQVLPEFGAKLRYQDEVMRAVDRFTTAGDTVLDGAGHALRREPAYRYWFLTTGVRFLAARGSIEPFDLEAARRNQPAAVIYDYRLAIYLEQFPQLRDYLFRHYVPLYRNLWIAGLSATTKQGASRLRWTAPRDGDYQLIVSESLARHPWFTQPVAYAHARGPVAPRLAIPLRQLLPFDGALRVLVDGRPHAAGDVLTVRKGATVAIEVTSNAPAGVVLVPAGLDVLGLAPAGDFLF